MFDLNWVPDTIYKDMAIIWIHDGYTKIGHIDCNNTAILMVSQMDKKGHIMLITNAYISKKKSRKWKMSSVMYDVPCPNFHI